MIRHASTTTGSTDIFCPRPANRAPIHPIEEAGRAQVCRRRHGLWTSRPCGGHRASRHTDGDGAQQILIAFSGAVEQVGFTGVALPSGVGLGPRWSRPRCSPARSVNCGSSSPRGTRRHSTCGRSGGRLLLKAPDDRGGGPSATAAIASHNSQDLTCSPGTPRAGVSEARRLLAALDSGGFLTTHSGDTAQLEVHPNLWVGTGLVPGTPDLAIVSNHAQVADRGSIRLARPTHRPTIGPRGTGGVD